MTQPLRVSNQLQKSLSGQSHTNIQQLFLNHGDISNPNSGNEKWSSFEGNLEDLGLNDRLKPEFFGTKYSKLFVNRSSMHKQGLVYCMPGQQKFYDIIPKMPRDARQTADFFLENLLNF